MRAGMRAVARPLAAGACVAAALALAPVMLPAQEVNICAWQATGANIAEPWEQNSRSFAHGKVRIALLDTIEPAAASFYILVLSPPYDEAGGRQCVLVTADGGGGFGAVDFAALKARYDAAVGLVISVPVTTAHPGLGAPTPQMLRFSVNQATGAILTGLEPAAR